MYRDRLASRLGHVDQHLSQHEYMLGRQFSLADAYLFVVLNWARSVNVDLSPYPHVLAHRKRVGARLAAGACKQRARSLKAKPAYLAP
jgi:glutathione S-transferase